MLRTYLRNARCVWADRVLIWNAASLCFMHVPGYFTLGYLYPALDRKRRSKTKEVGVHGVPEMWRPELCGMENASKATKKLVGRYLWDSRSHQDDTRDA